MCGISGEHRRDGSRPSPEQLKTMALCMVHRGPDDDGILTLPGIGFGFRRLSIIDLEGGAQPLTGCSEKVWIQGNGEIYNYRELRSELLRLGHQFSTDSDIEVIAHGYEEWGDDVLHRLNGMFGIAIWDVEKARLLLARDHLGVKPLYYLDTGKRLLFGSEMKPILSNQEITTELDPDGLRLFLHFGYVPAPHTLVKGLKKLQPGHMLISDANGSTVRRYWEANASINHDISVEEAVEVYHELTNAAVERQMVSDVPVGILLSGGVDSAMILAAASDRTNQQLSTFTVGFGDDFQMDEARQAAGTAAMFNTDHHEIRIKPRSFPEVFEQSLWHMEEPVLSQSTFAFQMLTAEVRKHVKVVLTGQGADEPWAGYHRYIGERYGANARWLFGSTAAAAVANVVPGGARLRRATASLGESDPIERFTAIHQVFSPDQIAASAHGALLDANVAPQDAIRYWQKPVEHLDQFSQLLHVDCRMSLADDLLFYGDKLSMSNSVEARVPFLDRELFDFVESLPPSFKLRMGRGKYVHKLVAEKMLPRELVHRTKRGFDTPVDEWFADDFSPLLHENVLSSDSLCSSILDRDLIVGLLDDHISGRRNNRRQLTALLSLELSARQVLTRPPVPPTNSANTQVTEVTV